MVGELVEPRPSSDSYRTSSGTREYPVGERSRTTVGEPVEPWLVSGSLSAVADRTSEWVQIILFPNGRFSLIHQPTNLPTHQ